MKAFLVILLLALTTSKFQDDIINIAQCVLKSEKIKEEVLPKVISALKNGDFASLISIVLESFPKIKEEIMECLYSEPVLKYTCKNLKLYQVCSNKCDWLHDPQCDLNCQKKFCH